MDRYVCLFNTLVCLILLGASLPAKSFGRDAPDQDILSKMRSFDEAFLQSQTLVLSMETSTKRYAQGERGENITKITVTTHGGAMAIEREMSYTEKPVYRESTAATRIDYRDDGRLIVWRTTGSRSLIQADFQGHQDEYVCLLVSPDGQISEHQGGGSFDLYRPSDTQRYLQYWTPIWATGRGFAKSLSRITETGETEDGLMSFSASGFLNPLTQGTWHMVVDPKAGYLVRSASFTPNRAARPTFLCTTSGTKLSATCIIAERGTSGNARDLASQTVTTFQTKHYKPEPDKALFDRCRRILRGPYPKGSNIYDWVINPKNVTAYIAGDTGTPERDLLDAIEDTNIPGTRDKVSADAKFDSRRHPNEINEPSDQNSSAPNRPSAPAPAPAAAPPGGSKLYLIIALAVIAIAVVAIGAIRHAKSSR